MSKKVIAIAFSDLHINLWAKFNKDNKRTLDHFRVLQYIAETCTKNGCPALFCGDMFHKPENIDPDIALLMKDFMDKLYYDYPKFKCFAIEGNHDLKHINLLDVEDPERKDLTRGWVSLFENKQLVVLSPKTPPAHIKRGIMVHGVPYIDHNIGLNKYLSTLHLSEDMKHILLLHTDYPGAKDCDGRVVDSVENLNINVLNRFDLVLCGHIHKPQRLSKKVYMVGAPLQQRRTDRDTELGYWEVFDDLSMNFVSLSDKFPRFVDVESEDEIKDDGNYYTVLPKKSSIKVNTNHKITKQLSKKSLAKKYLKEKGIKDKNRKELLISILNKSEL